MSNKPLWFVTFVTHNSRVSERMVTFKVKSAEPLIFSAGDQELMIRSILGTCRKTGIAVFALNVLPDHVHLIVSATNRSELARNVRKIKGASSFTFQRAHKWPKGDEHVWAQKFNCEPILNEEALNKAINYIEHNHEKHAERWGEEIIVTRETRLKSLINKGL